MLSVSVLDGGDGGGEEEEEKSLTEFSDPREYNLVSMSDEN